LSIDEINEAIREHGLSPHERKLQKLLARELTVLVHSQDDYENALEASQVLFGKGTAKTLSRLDEASFLDVFEGVPVFNAGKDLFVSRVSLTDLLTEHTSIFSSKGEYRRMVSGGGVAINKDKVSDAEITVGNDDLIGGKYLLVQKGKKNYFLIVSR
jgi:tyrosyl-tRNA synthetase